MKKISKILVMAIALLVGCVVSVTGFAANDSIVKFDVVPVDENTVCLEVSLDECSGFESFDLNVQGSSFTDVTYGEINANANGEVPSLYMNCNPETGDISGFFMDSYTAQQFTFCKIYFDITDDVEITVTGGVQFAEMENVYFNEPFTLSLNSHSDSSEQPDANITETAPAESEVSSKMPNINDKADDDFAKVTVEEGKEVTVEVSSDENVSENTGINSIIKVIAIVAISVAGGVAVYMVLKKGNKAEQGEE